MANIVLKTFAAGDDGQGTVTPQDDALIYQNAIPMNGIFSGATVTLSEANVLHIAAGFGIIGGRFFEINESDITVELSSSGTLLGRLYIHLELTNADVPISINVATGASLPALVGDPDLNINDGAFDLELATFSVSEVTISDIVNTFPIISKANNQLRRATAYSLNDMVLCQSASDSLIFICTTAGTTAVQQPTGYATITDGNTITDGTAVFKAVGLTAEIDRTRAIIAPVLSTLVAPSGGLASGDQFVYNGLLYKATAAIAQGGTITIDGNCALANSITEQLNDNTNLLPTNLATGVTVTAGGYSKIGKLIIVNCRFSVSTSVNVNDTIAFFPTPAINTLAYISFANSKNLDISLTASGVLRTGTTSGTGTGTLIVSGAYMQR